MLADFTHARMDGVLLSSEGVDRPQEGHGGKKTQKEGEE